MARVSVKYPCGKKVLCGGVPGMVTAIFIRGKGRGYEFSYIDSDGNPKSCTAEECELESVESNPLGFRSNNNQRDTALLQRKRPRRIDYAFD